jgi:hypothetical protein
MNLTTENRLTFVKYALLAALSAAVIISYPLWLSESRYFPLVPVFDFIPAVVSPFDEFLFYVFIALIAAAFVYPLNFTLNISLLSLMLIYALLDLNRLQPWFYQYMLILLVIIGAHKKTELSLPLLQLIIAGTFIWSGIHKFNAYFFSETAPWLSESLGGSRLAEYMFYFVPIDEVLIGFALLFSKTRLIGIIAGTVFHLFIFFILSPWGLDYNHVVMPWNFALVVFLWAAFYKTNNNFRAYLQLRKSPLASGIIILVYALPILHIFNLWPAYVSFNLYSGNTSRGYVFISEPVKTLLPEEISLIIENNRLDISAWSMKELSVPCFPEKSTFIKAADFIKGYSNEENEVVLLFQAKSSIFGRETGEFP